MNAKTALGEALSDRPGRPGEVLGLQGREEAHGHGVVKSVQRLADTLADAARSSTATTPLTAAPSPSRPRPGTGLESRIDPAHARVAAALVTSSGRS